MSAEVLKLDTRSPDAQGIRYAASWLRRGSVVGIPTDTLYALAADPVNLSAVEEIFRVKGRPESRALPILINSLAQARMLSRDLPANFYRLASACWPGPLTIVVEASNRLPLKVTANTRRIALRWSDNKIVSHLIEELGVPLTGTSANLSGSVTCSSAKEVLEQLGDRIPLILDGGEAGEFVPSTIVELHGREWKIGREGAITEAEIDDALGGEGSLMG